MKIEIRQGVASDAAQTTPLILSAAQSLLTSIFGHNKNKTADGYLSHAWKLGGGQYGFNNHWVACSGDEVLGVVTAWHSKLGAAFDRATLDSITSYFTLDEAMTVLMRNQTVAINLTPPTNTELMIGHLSVEESARRTGVGSMLMDAMQARAEKLVVQCHDARTSCRQGGRTRTPPGSCTHPLHAPPAESRPRA